MPLRMWEHLCCDPTPGALSSSEPCLRCGKPGKFAGWHHSKHEAMAIYQNMHGLKPIGPHRPLADTLFGEFRAKCLPCSGTGSFDLDFGRGFRICRDCDGAGYRFELNDEETGALRQRVLESYPDAAVNARIADVHSAILAFNWATNTVEAVSRSNPKGPQK